MPSSTTPSPNTVPFPPPQTFDILPEIYDLIIRLPSSTASSTVSTTGHASISNPIDPKDLPQAAVPIKLKIQKAKAAVSAMPDVDRNIEEQQDEVRELERRIEKLRAVVGELGTRAGAGARDGAGEGG